MKLIKALALVAVAVSLVTMAQAEDKAPKGKVAGCCAKAAKEGKKCEHECCVKAAKEGKNCEKCKGTNE
jgi:hypothetical protein